MAPSSGYGIHSGESPSSVSELEPALTRPVPFSLPAVSCLSAQTRSCLPILFSDANCSSAQTSMCNLPMIPFSPCNWLCPQVPVPLTRHVQWQVPALSKSPLLLQWRGQGWDQCSVAARKRNLKRGLITKRIWKHLIEIKEIQAS